jgi:peptidoglycan/xylan/chitin deacetylase (PgdA/CDA1 family)
MKKYLLVFLYLACLTILVAGCGRATNHETQKPATIQKPRQSIPSSGKPEPKTVLTILGVSNRLTAAQVDAMNQWRESARDLAIGHPDEVFVNGYTKKKMVCLTFDDGPDAENTAKVLDILRSENVHGNFFFKGNHVRKYPEVVKRAYSEGNLVLSHAYSHQELDHMNAYDIDKEIWATEKAFYEVIGQKPALMRPPYGAVNDDVIREAEDNGCKLILWSIDTLDWSQKEPDNITDNVLANVRPGDIILMHSNEDRQATVEALPRIIRGLEEQGYEITTLDKMLGTKAYN